MWPIATVKNGQRYTSVGNGDILEPTDTHVTLTASAKMQMRPDATADPPEVRLPSWVSWLSWNSWRQRRASSSVLRLLASHGAQYTRGQCGLLVLSKGNLKQRRCRFLELCLFSPPGIGISPSQTSYAKPSQVHHRKRNVGLRWELHVSRGMLTLLLTACWWFKASKSWWLVAGVGLSGSIGWVSQVCRSVRVCPRYWC